MVVVCEEHGDPPFKEALSFMHHHWRGGEVLADTRSKSGAVRVGATKDECEMHFDRVIDREEGRYELISAREANDPEESSDFAVGSVQRIGAFCPWNSRSRGL